MWNIIVAATLAVASPGDVEARADALSAQVDALYDAHRFDDAAAASAELIHLLEERGPETPAMIDALLQLGNAEMQRANYEDAEASFSRATDLARATLGASDPERTNAIRRLATALNHQARYHEVEPLLTEALAILRVAHARGEDPGEQLALALGDLGRLRQQQGRYDEASALLVDGIAVFEGDLNRSEGHYGAALSNLARLKRARGRFDEAHALYERSLAIYRENFGEDHPDTASVINNLAALEFARGRYSEARAHFEQGLEVWTKLYGDQHPLLTTGLSNIAICLEADGKYQAALPLLERVLAIRIASLESGHPLIATANAQPRRYPGPPR